MFNVRSVLSFLLIASWMTANAAETMGTPQSSSLTVSLGPISPVSINDINLTQQKLEIEEKIHQRVLELKLEISNLDKKIEHDNVWIFAHSAYSKHHQEQLKLAQIKSRIQSLSLNGDTSHKKELQRLEKDKKKTIKQLRKLDNEEKASFEKLLDYELVNLRLDATEFSLYESALPQLQSVTILLRKKDTLLEELSLIDQTRDYKNERTNTKEMLEKFETVQKTISVLQDKRFRLITKLSKSLDKINQELDKDSIWEKSYNAYLTYLQLTYDLRDLHARIEKLAEVGDTMTEKDELEQLMEKEKILNDQLSLLKGHGTSPFANLLQPEDIDERPDISNPIDIFTGISYNKRMAEQLKVYVKRGADLRQLMIIIRKKINILGDMATIDLANDYTPQLSEATQRLEKFEVALSTLVSTQDVYAKRVEEVELQVNKQIEKQLYKLVNIGIIIIVLFLFFFLTKMMAKKYITDNERFYMANKVITFVNVTLIILILLFNYIENVNYLVTVLGFASAGIAIAMKDWFMSMLGWLVIVIGGSIHVGDRVRVDKDGMLYVGDVLDISLLRITILEDITLTTYKHNRRAGRIIFIPNNYVFTTMIANYTHVSLKTVWDGIDIMITFDSNHKKAMHIAKEIARKYAKGYTDITRKQLNKLRNRYSLKNTNVEPRIFSFVEPYGIQISTWYLTNAYATLTLRSSISMEIIDAFNLEDDITIAYPTQHLNLSNVDRKMPSQDEGTEIL